MWASNKLYQEISIKISFSTMPGFVVSGSSSPVPLFATAAWIETTPALEICVLSHSLTHTDRRLDKVKGCSPGVLCVCMARTHARTRVFACLPVWSFRTFCGYYGPPVHLLATMGRPYICWLIWAARTFAGYYGPPLHLLANMGRPYICRFEASLSKFAIETPRVAP